jgi:subtilisin family serine protease
VFIETDALDLVKLTPVMNLTAGEPEITIGLLDGPVALDHPDLAVDHIREVPSAGAGKCSQASSMACKHGTFTAGVLCAKRNAAAPAICPGCTILVTPIFPDVPLVDGVIPSVAPERLATAMFDCIDAGARLLNLSAAITQVPSLEEEQAIGQVLDHAVKRGAIVVAAAGNQTSVGSTVITRHPWVIPVAACDRRGQPLSHTNLGRSIGRRGLASPGEGVISLGIDSGASAPSGTSVATPFVTGAIALAWSAFPSRTATEVRAAVAEVHPRHRAAIVPPLLDAQATYRAMTHSPRR